MQYDFKWDPGKAKRNHRKHGVDFCEAATIFRDPRMMTLYDSEHSGSEERWITLGLSLSGRLLVTCHTFLENPGESVVIRIISSRKATTKERREYLR